MGGALGLVLAFGGVRMLIAFAARYSPRAGEIRIDGVVLAFTLVLAILVAVLLSFAPTLARENALGAALAAGGDAADRRRAAPAAAADAGRRADRGVGDAAHRRRPAHAHDAAARRSWTPG